MRFLQFISCNCLLTYNQPFLKCSFAVVKKTFSFNKICSFNNSVLFKFHLPHLGKKYVHPQRHFKNNYFIENCLFLLNKCHLYSYFFWFLSLVLIAVVLAFNIFFLFFSRPHHFIMYHNTSYDITLEKFFLCTSPF